MPFTATWVDLGIIMLSELSQKAKDKCQKISLIYGIQTMTRMKLFMKQKQIHREQTWGCQGGGMNWEFDISRHKLLYVYIIKSLCGTPETNTVL